MKSNDEIVEEFAKKIGSCTHVGGFHTCILDDPKDNETYKQVATDWLRSTLEAKDKEADERVREELRPLVQRVRLDVEVIKCDCGEPYKDSDLDLSVGELEQALSPTQDR